MLKSIRNGCRRLAIPFQCWASPFRCGTYYVKSVHLVNYFLSTPEVGTPSSFCNLPYWLDHSTYRPDLL
ncbi:hypothetical protein [Salmonella phage ST56]|nr:hypothetical protein [Salmonella phage ST56]WJJ60593.1 hypothetical protein [Salmonella phage ST10]